MHRLFACCSCRVTHTWYRRPPYPGTTVVATAALPILMQLITMSE